MRDSLARWLVAGAILALPICIQVVSLTSGSSTGPGPGVDTIGRGVALLLLVEVVVAAGIWLAARERRHLGVE